MALAGGDRDGRPRPFDGNRHFVLALATATAGVLVVAPALRDALLVALRWPGEGVHAALAETIATAAGAAACVLPVQVAVFGHFTPWSVLANVLVAPLYEAALLVTALAAALG